MNRRTLIRTSSLFVVTSIFSASTSVIESRRANAKQMLRVNPNNSSCARKIDAVFRHYRLKVESFDIRYQDRSGQYYIYASSKSSIKSIQKIDAQPESSLSSISLDTDPSFDNSKSTIAQWSLDWKVLKDIRKAMTLEGVTLNLAKLNSIGPDGEPCYITFPCGKSTYCTDTPDNSSSPSNKGANEYSSRRWR
jgi:hypothetical protein